MHYLLLQCFISPFLVQIGEHGHWYSSFQQACLQGRHHRCEAKGESWVGLIDLLCAPKYFVYHHHQCHYEYIDDVLWYQALRWHCFLPSQSIAVELLCGSAPLGPHLDVCCASHHWPPLRPLPDPLRHLRLSGRFHHCHGPLHSSQRGKDQRKQFDENRKQQELK